MQLTTHVMTLINERPENAPSPSSLPAVEMARPILCEELFQDLFAEPLEIAIGSTFFVVCTFALGSVGRALEGGEYLGFVLFFESQLSVAKSFAFDSICFGWYMF